MEALHLRQSGEYDATFEARIASDGAYRVEGGSYVTRGAREGVLSRAEVARLAALADAVDLSAEHPIPDDAPGFTSELTVGEQALRWWGPPPTDALQALTGALAALGA